jgi:hypothetical protein
MSGTRLPARETGACPYSPVGSFCTDQPRGVALRGYGAAPPLRFLATSFWRRCPIGPRHELRALVIDRQLSVRHRKAVVAVIDAGRIGGYRVSLKAVGLRPASRQLQ